MLVFLPRSIYLSMTSNGNVLMDTVTIRLQILKLFAVDYDKLYMDEDLSFGGLANRFFDSIGKIKAKLKLRNAIYDFSVF